MEPNAEQIFLSKDPDGDQIRITTASRGRITLRAGTPGGVSAMSYLNRRSAQRLMEALSKWLGYDEEEDHERAKDISPAFVTPSDENRRKALELAVSLFVNHERGTTKQVLEVAERFARYLEWGRTDDGGEAAGLGPELGPMPLQVQPEFRAQDTCGPCGHPMHGLVQCSYGTGPRCQCRGFEIPRQR